MRVYIKQKMFSLLDTFTVLDEHKQMIYYVKSKVGFGHKFLLFNHEDKQVGYLEEVLFSLRHTFNMYGSNGQIGQIIKEISFFKPKFTINAKGYTVTGDFLEWDYEITKNGKIVGKIEKILALTDMYSIDVDEDCIIDVLMIVLAIDAVKCDHSK